MQALSQLVEHLVAVLLSRQIFVCHLETGRAHRIALLHVHVLEALVNVSTRCDESPLPILFVPLSSPGSQLCLQLLADSRLSSPGTLVSAFVLCHAQADRHQREVRRPRARIG